MLELIAKGKIGGKDVEVVCETRARRWYFLFNGEENPVLEEQLRELMDEHRSVGNYPPKTKKLALWGILESGLFFDRTSPRHVEVFGPMEQIPYDGDKIY